MKPFLLALPTFFTFACAWLPGQNQFSKQSGSSSQGQDTSGSSKIRGVNVGSLFIIEPWMISSEWKSMGCGDTKAESECVAKLGQDAANKVWQQHWDTYISDKDLDNMKSHGLNTIRVPLGYWIVESLVKDGEHFPQGGMKYLDRLMGWAASRNIYVILDLHGAPGAQVTQQAFTGQEVDTTGFFQSDQYSRAYQFLQNITARVHQNQAYSSVGMLEVLNEPEHNHPSLISEYYATAISKIRETEAKLNVTKDKQLTIQFMDAGWGAGDPSGATSNDTDVAVDDHRYLKWANIDQTKDTYISTSCKDSFTPSTIVGEWSLSIKDELQWNSDFDPKSPQNQAWYKQWWATQIVSYEKSLGWVFWSWKMEGDYRWSYSDAITSLNLTSVDAAAGLAKC